MAITNIAKLQRPESVRETLHRSVGTGRIPVPRRGLDPFMIFTLFAVGFAF